MILMCMQPILEMHTHRLLPLGSTTSYMVLSFGLDIAGKRAYVVCAIALYKLCEIGEGGYLDVVGCVWE